MQKEKNRKFLTQPIKMRKNKYNFNLIYIRDKNKGFYGEERDYNAHRGINTKLS